MLLLEPHPALFQAFLQLFLEVHRVRIVCILFLLKLKARFSSWSLIPSGSRHGFISTASVWKILLLLLWSSKLLILVRSFTALQNFYLLVRSGARPWYPFDSHYDPKWDFSYGDISEAYDQMMMYAGPDEWRKMFDAFRFFCFKCDGFDIVQTATMGLGK